MRIFTVIDAYGLLFRAYYALPNLSTSYGLPIGGVYGFINIFLKYIEKHSTDYLVVVFDTGSKNFRHDIYPEYKSNRPKLPNDLISQFSLLREAVSAFNIASEEVIGYEADDVIATLTKKYSQLQDVEVTVVTSDKDLLQLLNYGIRIFDPIKNRYIEEEDVHNKFGISSNQLLDFLSLTGDASDNIPGVPGIGVKTAAKLLNDFGSLNDLLLRAQEIKTNRCRESIVQYSDQAILSRQLVTLCDTVDICGGIEKYIFQNSEIHELTAFLKKYELQSLINKVNKIFKQNVPSTNRNLNNSSDIVTSDKAIQYSAEGLSVFIENCKSEGIIALHIEIVDNSIGSISLSYRKEVFFYIDKDHVDDALEFIKPIFSLGYILKVIYDVKTLLKIIPNLDIVAFNDIMVMSYVLNPGVHDHSLQNIISYNVEQSITNMNAANLLLLHELLRKSLFVDRLYTVYERVEKPLIRVLDNMEKIGVLVNVDVLKTLSATFSEKINMLESEIYKLSGAEFNIASSKQLGNILFDKMGIKKGKKLSSGNYSTDAEVLSDLAFNDVEIADKILKWRHLTKLKTTYTDVLEKQKNSNSGRVHTFYSMVSTATGRLSSSNPNLQNIPVRSEEGNSIRRAFIAKKGYKLISADYSQIELRIMAHIADVQAFKNAFFLNQDIHSITAKQIFNTEKLDKNLRRRAKSINFGIIYGMSAFGLAKQLSISRSEASTYINNYFRSYPEIQSYMENIKAYAKTHGYTRTIFGRKCFVKDINSDNVTARNFSERAAINAPLQGTSADIIKMSMIHLFDKLKNGSLILQVHDELLFEILEEQVDDAVKIIREVMENIVKLSVPLKVDFNIGDNWADLVPYNSSTT
ncbi:DNA polymerase I [Ehrlichia canis]|uniref:DNA polymerase, family A n=1 Tax=Ehrlichia canis (strain Jake) TaxID=269484 RepID=A0ACA6AV28_EHRCJ|nr:DNA polymerase I [Ehrlichia canis]AAZ68099.1 DNA polymerase, family A [Ehrlichia canis str. Jake]AUO54353.1 DNA polymerase I [Ehrlichia canis]UKC53003.1 polA [Ehrlichia canis]UKC53940.1 polA [Ehrlichia canis]UKC54876.1 polA [Ehrlichia canis]